MYNIIRSQLPPYEIESYLYNNLYITNDPSSDAYKNLFESVKKVFPHSSMQIWYPDEKTDDVLYKQNASSTGTTLAINLPESLDEVRYRMENVWEHVFAPEQLSCLSKKGFSIIGLIASRHFRTPVIPIYWQIRKNAGLKK